MYSGGRQFSDGGRWNSGGGVLSAAWSATSLSGFGTVKSTTETPAGVCDILTVSQSCCIVVGSVVDSSHAVCA